jgi:hypothetical protein
MIHIISLSFFNKADGSVPAALCATAQMKDLFRPLQAEFCSLFLGMSRITRCDHPLYLSQRQNAVALLGALRTAKALGVFPHPPYR